MNTIVSPAENLIAANNHRKPQFITITFVALGYQIRMAIRDLSGQLERRFAAFADVPYDDPLSRQQWEQLWEAESYCPSVVRNPRQLVIEPR
jgi:hypothetical protein